MWIDLYEGFGRFRLHTIRQSEEAGQSEDGRDHPGL